MEACWRACFAENGRLPAERCSAARSPGSRAWSSRSSSTGSAPAPHTCRHGACLGVCQRCGICRASRVIPQLLRQVPAAHVQARLSIIASDHNLGAVRVLSMAGRHATPPRSSSTGSAPASHSCSGGMLSGRTCQTQEACSKLCDRAAQAPPRRLRTSRTPDHIKTAFQCHVLAVRQYNTRLRLARHAGLGK